MLCSTLLRLGITVDVSLLGTVLVFAFADDVVSDALASIFVVLASVVL